MTINGERTYQELLGEPCFSMEQTPPSRKQICTSRSFGEMTAHYEVLTEAVANYASSCTRKLRLQKSVAISLMVFIHTSHFRTDQRQYSRNIIVKLPVPSSDTRKSFIMHRSDSGKYSFPISFIRKRE